MNDKAIELPGHSARGRHPGAGQKPDLPPGRVKVTVEAMSDLTQTDVWQVLEKIWAGQRARGYVPRSREEIDAELEASRQEDEERGEVLERIQEECHQARLKRQPRGVPMIVYLDTNIVIYSVEHDPVFSPESSQPPCRSPSRW